MPANASQLKPAPRSAGFAPVGAKPDPMCSCVLGTEAHAKVIGAGHKVAAITHSVHQDKAFRFLMSPFVLRRHIAQCLAVARELGEDVAEFEVAMAALERTPLRHGYDKPLPSIEYRGPIAPGGTRRD